MKIKPGVKIAGLRPEMVLGIRICANVIEAHAECVITSAMEGRHSAGSLHYVGCAVDLRSRDIPESLRVKVLDQMAEALGDDFDILLEKDHYHLEFQPKTGANN